MGGSKRNAICNAKLLDVVSHRLLLPMLQVRCCKCCSIELDIVATRTVDGIGLSAGTSGAARCHCAWASLLL